MANAATRDKIGRIAQAECAGSVSHLSAHKNFLWSGLRLSKNAGHTDMETVMQGPNSQPTLGRRVLLMPLTWLFLGAAIGLITGREADGGFSEFSPR
jgi:hypothetical protein